MRARIVMVLTNCNDSMALKQPVMNPTKKNVKEFLGPEIKLTDKKKLCVGAAFCVRNAGIWNLTVHSDRPGFKEIAIEEAANFPLDDSLFGINRVI